MPGSKSGWVTVRDAVKKKLPKEAPKPGKFRVSEAAEAKVGAGQAGVRSGIQCGAGGRASICRRRASGKSCNAGCKGRRSGRQGCRQGRVRCEEEGGRVMELKIVALDGKEAGKATLSDTIFGLEPRTDIIQRCVNWQLAKRQRGTHKTKGRAEIWRTGKKMYAQKGTGGARHGSARVPQFRGGGRAFGPVVRSHAIDLPKKVRALALKHALSSKAKDGGIIVIDKATLERRQDQGAGKAVRQARPRKCADYRRRRDRRQLPQCGAQHSEYRCPAGSGHQRV